jgi:integrase
MGKEARPCHNNPVKDVDLLDQGEHEPWPDWLLGAGAARRDLECDFLWQCSTLHAQRIGDVCGMRWSDIAVTGTLSLAAKNRPDAHHPDSPRSGRLLDQTPKTGAERFSSGPHRRPVDAPHAAPAPSGMGDRSGRSDRAPRAQEERRERIARSRVLVGRDGGDQRADAPGDRALRQTARYDGARQGRDPALGRAEQIVKRKTKVKTSAFPLVTHLKSGKRRMLIFRHVRVMSCENGGLCG